MPYQAPPYSNLAQTYGQAPYNYDQTYGGTPAVPDLPATQAAAIAGNVQNLPDLQNLATRTNQFNQSALLGQYGTAIPGYTGLLSSAGQNVRSNLAGQIAPDVWRNIQTRMAERGINIGSSGSPNSNAAMLQALGLTSTSLANLGQQQLSSLTASTPVAQPWNPSQFYWSPEQTFQAQQGANIYAAAPVPSMAGRAGISAAQSGINAGLGGGGGPGFVPSGGGRPTPNTSSAAADNMATIVGRYLGGGNTSTGTGGPASTNWEAYGYPGGGALSPVDEADTTGDWSFDEFYSNLDPANYGYAGAG